MNILGSMEMLCSMYLYHKTGMFLHVFLQTNVIESIVGFYATFMTDVNLLH